MKFLAFKIESLSTERDKKVFVEYLVTFYFVLTNLGNDLVGKYSINDSSILKLQSYSGLTIKKKKNHLNVEHAYDRNRLIFFKSFSRLSLMLLN